jgi:hypothetical protein
MVLRHLVRGLMPTRKRAPPPVPAHVPPRAVPSPLHGTCFYGHHFREIDLARSGWGRTRQCVRCDLCWSITAPENASHVDNIPQRRDAPASAPGPDADGMGPVPDG